MLGLLRLGRRDAAAALAASVSAALARCMHAVAALMGRAAMRRMLLAAARDGPQSPVCALSVSCSTPCAQDSLAERSKAVAQGAIP